MKKYQLKIRFFFNKGISVIPGDSVKISGFLVTTLPLISDKDSCLLFYSSFHVPVYMNHVILQELAVMKQVLISMRSRHGDAPNLLETDKTGIRTSGAGKHQSKRINRTSEEESPNKPKPTVFVSVWLGNALVLVTPP